MCVRSQLDQCRDSVDNQTDFRKYPLQQNSLRGSVRAEISTSFFRGMLQSKLEVDDCGFQIQVDCGIRLLNLKHQDCRTVFNIKTIRPSSPLLPFAAGRYEIRLHDSGSSKDNVQQLVLTPVSKLAQQNPTEAAYTNAAY